MKLITMSIAATIWALALTTSFAQETQTKAEIENSQKVKLQIEGLQESRENMINREKYDLKQEVEAINKRLENNEIFERSLF